MRNKWSDLDLECLQLNYAKYGAAYCEQQMNYRHSIASIKVKAMRMNLHSYFQWSEPQVLKLQQLWYDGTKNELLEAFPNISYEAIQQKAINLGFKTSVNRSRRGDLGFMDNLNCIESYYWWGFVMADGCMSTKNEFIITISTVDESNLQRLANKLKTQIHYADMSNAYGHYHACSIRISDQKFCGKWKKLLDLEGKKKTYNSPNLTVFDSKEYLIYFLIGLLDGDGCIAKSRGTITISISNHISWKPAYDWLFDKIYEYYGIPFRMRIDGHGCIQANLCRTADVLKLYNYAANCEDRLHRKWDKIHEQLIIRKKTIQDIG